MDAYSLIEQGRVAAFLDSNSQDRARNLRGSRRHLAVQASARKRPCGNWNEPDLNLSQSQLVLDEVEKQLAQRQGAGGLGAELLQGIFHSGSRNLRSAYVMQEYDGLHKKAVAIGDQLGEVVDELGRVRRQMEEPPDPAGGIATWNSRSRRKPCAGAERELLASQNEQASTRQRGDFARQQIAQLSEQKELLATRHGEMSERFTARTQEANRHQDQLALIDEKLREHEAEVADSCRFSRSRPPRPSRASTVKRRR